MKPIQILVYLATSKRGRKLCIFLIKPLSYKFRDNLAVNSNAIECLCIKVLKKYFKSVFLNLTYRLPISDPNEPENHFKTFFFSNQKIRNKELVLVGDFYINALDFHESKMVHIFVNLMFWHDLIPTVNKPAHVTKNTACATDHRDHKIIKKG